MKPRNQIDVNMWFSRLAEQVAIEFLFHCKFNKKRVKQMMARISR